MPYRYLYIFFLAVSVAFAFACSKEDTEDAAVLYGSWKTSYGDTIRFYHENGKDFLYNDQSGNPGPPGNQVAEYFFQQNKLSIKENVGSTTMLRSLSSFTWVNEGREFSVQGLEWFNYISSTITVFTFTKID